MMSYIFSVAEHMEHSHIFTVQTKYDTHPKHKTSLKVFYLQIKDECDKLYANA